MKTAFSKKIFIAIFCVVFAISFSNSTNAGMPTEYYRQTFVGVENILFSITRKNVDTLQLLPLDQNEVNDTVREILNRRLTEKYGFKVFTMQEGDFLRTENETLKTVLFVDVMYSAEILPSPTSSKNQKIGTISLLLTRYIKETDDPETLRPIKSSWFAVPFIIYDDKEQFKTHFNARMEDALFGYLKGVICRNRNHVKECQTLPSHIRNLEILQHVSPEIKKSYELQKKKWDEYLETFEE